MDWAEEKRRLVLKLLEIAKEKEEEFAIISKGAHERFIEAEGAMKSRYDTFKEEGEYLAGAFKIRHEKLKTEILIINEVLNELDLGEHEAINLYSIVSIIFADGQEARYFMFPALAGEIIDANITVITPSSPIGKALIDKEEGDEIVFTVNNQIKKGEINLVR